ncbi:MAG: TolC family protein [Arenimonas sp.]
MFILGIEPQLGIRRGMLACKFWFSFPAGRPANYVSRVLLGFLIAFLFSSAALATTVEKTSLDVRQLIEIARQDNKDLQAARYAVDLAEARLVQAGLRANPRLDLSARTDLLFGNEGEYSNAIGISQEFPIAGRLLHQKAVARVDIALAEVEIAEAERRMAGEIASKSYRFVVIEQQINSLNTLVGVEEKLARTTRDRFKAAEVSELDVNTVQLDIQRLVQERVQLQNEQQSILVSLNTLLGRSASSALSITEPLPKAISLPTLEQLEQQAFELRPDLRGAMLSIDRAEAEKKLATASRWQDWSVGLEFSQDKQVITGAPPQGYSRAIGISVSIPLPLFNKSQGLLAEAVANREQAQARVEALRLSIASEVLGIHAEVTRLQNSLLQYRKNMLPTSERNVRLAQQGYSQGLIPVFEVVQAQRQQTELNADYLNTLDQFLQALSRLHTATGEYVSASSDPHTKKKE